MNVMVRRVAFAVVALLLCMSDALAHKTSVTYLDLTDKQIAQGLWSLQLLLPVEELDLRFGLDVDGNSLLSRAELEQKIPSITRYATDRINLSALLGSVEMDCERRFINHHIDQHPDSQSPAVFLALRLQFKCPANAASLRIRYNLFAEFDAAHRALLSFADGQQMLMPGVTQSLLLAGDATSIGDSSAAANGWASFPGYLKAGFHHILIGWDHLAFLIALLIPLTAGRMGFTRRQAKSIFVTVTVFTLGHSISLAAVTLGLVSVPARSVEVLVAASIVIAAGFCLVRREFLLGPLLAVGFGLIHGFGFANVLETGGAMGPELWIGLLGFNLGVEAGQLLFIALALPVLAAAAGFSVSRPLVTRVLPVTLMIVGTAWFAERLTNIDLIPG